MDWTNLTFVGGSVIAILLKQFWLKDDTTKRDKLLPVLIFIGNLSLRIVAGIDAETFGLGDMTAESGSDVLYAGISWGIFRYPLVALVDTVMSMGLHRVKRWRDNIGGWKPTQYRKRK